MTLKDTCKHVGLIVTIKSGSCRMLEHMRITQSRTSWVVFSSDFRSLYRFQRRKHSTIKKEKDEGILRFRLSAEVLNSHKNSLLTLTSGNYQSFIHML